jgi:hypothetical protein
MQRRACSEQTAADVADNGIGYVKHSCGGRGLLVMRISILGIVVVIIEGGVCSRA